MKDMFYVGALDAGTTGVRFVILNSDAEPISSAYRALSLRFPQPGWVEQDPEEIRNAALWVIREATSQAGLDPSELVGFGITNQRETIVVWDKSTGKPLAPAIVWQDRRTADRCMELRRVPRLFQEIREKTGLLPDPYFSATKFEWLFRKDPTLFNKVQSGKACLGTVDSWLLFSLAGVYATDPTNASRTMLFALRQLRWDEELCHEFSVPHQALPAIFPSISIFGYTRRNIVGAKIPVAGILGDQQAALLGQACLERGDAKITWGTGAFLLVNVGEAPPTPPEGILATVAYTTQEGARYALEGSIFVAGAGVQWLRDNLELIRSSQESEELACILNDNDGVYFVPALTGLGAPYWDPYARGIFIGLTRGTTKAHLVRAALEAIAYQTYDLVDVFSRAIQWSISELRVDGGASQNNFLCQFQADILAKPVLRPVFLETTALGAAFACGWALGLWSPTDIRRLWREGRRFLPNMSEEVRRKLLHGWHKAVERARGWVEGG